MDTVKVPWDGWKIVKQIGKGSYGTVYEIERDVGDMTEKSAMKVISIPPDPNVISDYYSEGYDDKSISVICDSYLNKTIKEYEIMRSLGRDANIVNCDDMAHLAKEGSIGWDVYIRMELLTPLLNYIKYNDIDETEIIKLGKDICQALVQCDKKNVIHRDVKPSNIFVTKEGEYKLGDFGVARTLDHATNATRVGTERFMAPEVIKRNKYGKNIDIYSLGLVMYWLLNGKRMPYLKAGSTPTADEQEMAYSMRLSGKALPLPAKGTMPLKKAVLKACAYHPDDRYQSANEMLEELDSIQKALYSSKRSDVTNETATNEAKDTSFDKTTGNSWTNDYKTIAPNFTDSYSPTSDYDSKTLSPNWNAESGSNNKSRTSEASHIVYDEPSVIIPPSTSTFSKKEKVIGVIISILFLILFIAGLSYANKKNNTNGLLEDSYGNLAMFSHGEVDTSYNGLAEDESGEKYYISDGVVDKSFIGLVEDDYGITYYISDGTVDNEFTGLVDGDNAKYYVRSGMVDTDFTGLVTSFDDELYVDDGVVNDNYTGIINDKYVFKGVVDHNASGLTEVNGNWYYLTNGKVNVTYTGLVQNKFGWWYVKNGVVDFNHEGLVQNDYGWWYVKHGKIDFSADILRKNDYGWWVVENGKVDFNANGTYYWTEGVDKGKSIQYKNGQVWNATFHVGDNDDYLVVIENGKILKTEKVNT